MSRFMETESNNPKSNHKQLPQELIFSASSNRSFGVEMNLWSPFYRKNNKRKKWGPKSLVKFHLIRKLEKVVLRKNVVRAKSLLMKSLTKTN